jgi:hypothetical protein
VHQVLPAKMFENFRKPDGNQCGAEGRDQATVENLIAMGAFIGLAALICHDGYLFFHVEAFISYLIKSAFQQGKNRTRPRCLNVCGYRR